VGLLAAITLKVVSFRDYTQFLAILPSFKFILEIVFYEGVQHRLRFCLDLLDCVKMTDFQFYLQSMK
jgi:hypothetical protein